MFKIKKDLKKILCAVVLSTFLYAFLHELGHCIAVWFYGGRVTGFHFLLLWDAHVSYEGDGLAWKPLIHLAGLLFPVLIAFCLLFTYRRNSAGTFVYYLKTIYIYLCMGSLGSWISRSILFLSGAWGRSEDEYKFLIQSDISPVTVILTATVTILLMAFILINRITATASNQWQRKNVRRMGIWLAGVLMIVDFTMPLFLRLDALVETGGYFQLTEKDGSADSILKKQYEVEIEENGSYVLNVYWGGECSGVITGFALSLGDETVFYCTAEKLYAEYNQQDLQSGTYTLSLYSINSREDWEAFFEMIDREVPELEDYDFQGTGRYAVYGKYEFVRK